MSFTHYSRDKQSNKHYQSLSTTGLPITDLQILAVLRPVNVGHRAGDALAVADPLRTTIQGRQRVDVHTSVVRAHSQQAVIRTETEREKQRERKRKDRERGREREREGERKKEKGRERKREGEEAGGRGRGREKRIE